MLQLTENKQHEPVLIENFEPTHSADKSACPPWREQEMEVAVQCPRAMEPLNIYNAEVSGAGIDEAQVPDTFGHSPNWPIRRDCERPRGRAQDRDGQIPQWQGDDRGVSGRSGEARTLPRGDRHPRMVGAERLGEGTDPKNRRVGLRRAGRGPLSWQDRDDSGGSPRVDA